MDEQKRTNWQVRTRIATRANGAPELLMAWGKDKGTGQPRYILDLTEAEGGAACNCQCADCGMTLIAVNAGKAIYRRRPHFRHEAGGERRTCLIAAARAGLLASLAEVGYVTLPGHRRDARITGLSGHVYEAWVEVPPEAVKVLSTAIVDEASAIVRLEDGREFRVLLVGSRNSATVDAPTVEIVVDDPALAAFSPEDLRNRMRLDVRAGNWCSHWQDLQLDADAAKAAVDLATDSIDYGSPNRESALHEAAKKILELECCILVPALRVSEANQIRPAALLELEDVSLEHPLGEIRPDVKARTVSHIHWPADDLLIEVTVSNRITSEREARIKKRNLPALEINLSMLAGRVTLTEFRDLVVRELEGKRWIHHPAVTEAERIHVFGQDDPQKVARTSDAPSSQRGAGIGESRREGSFGPGGAFPEPKVATGSEAARAPRAAPRSVMRALQRVSDGQLANQPCIMVPDLTVRLSSATGMSSPYPQVIRAARALKIREITVGSTRDSVPALRIKTIAAPDWPAETLFVELSIKGFSEPDTIRIRERGQPTLTVELGRVDPEALDESLLRRLVFNEFAAKRWLFHPSIDDHIRRFEATRSQQAALSRTASTYSARRG